MTHSESSKLVNTVRVVLGTKKGTFRNGTATTAPLSRTTEFEHDDAGRVINITDPLDRETTFTYDAEGNMTAGPLPGEAAFVSYISDARNCLTSVNGTSYQYDAEGNRIRQTDGSGTTSYAIDPNTGLSHVLVRTKPDGRKTYYVYGIGLQYEVDEFENTLTYHYDFRGSTRAVIADDGQTITDKVEYSPYGTVTHREGTTDTPFLYNGMFGVITDGNGLLQMRARYYNPYLKRFVNADPIGFAGGMNWYQYAAGNPISYIDPSGYVFGTPLTYGEFFGAAVSGAAHGAKVYGKGLAVGAATGVVVVGGAAAAVAVGVPTAVVTGVVFTGAVVGGGILAVDTIQDPSLDNITYNAGLLAGGVLVGSTVAKPLGAKLSPSGYQQSVTKPTLQQEFSMMWKGADEKASLNALFSEFGTAMGTGPTFGGTVGGVGFSAGLSTNTQPIK